MGIEIPWLEGWETAQMCFCEETLDTYPKHPADTWSNIGPLIAGIVIWRQSRWQAAPLRAISFAVIITALFSAVFHATNTAVGEVLDLAGMYTFVFACGAVQLFRRKWLDRYTSVVLAFSLAAVCSGLASVSIWGKTPLFAVVLAVVIYWEVTDPRVVSYRNAYYSLASLGVAFVFWILDFTGLLCDPQNHILTGHGMWHLLSGLTFYFAYRQFVTSVGEMPYAVKMAITNADPEADASTISPIERPAD